MERFESAKARYSQFGVDVEAALKAKYGEQSIVNIHIEPYQGETVDSSKSCTD